MNIEQNQLNHLRIVQLELLDEFVRICNENNLSYFLTAGTLLGAVRHKGFIPWDDDIDVAMPRSDYEIFLTIFKNSNLSNYYIAAMQDPINTFYHYLGYTKFCKKGTVFAKEYLLPEQYIGIYIDIWPFDNCIKFLAPLQKKITTFSWILYRFKTNCIKFNIEKKHIIAKFFIFLPLNFIKKLTKISYTIFNTIKTKYVINFPSKYKPKKEIQKYSDIFPFSKIIFENKEYNSPGNIDSFLKNIYGNYMQLPPVEQQVLYKFLYLSFEENKNNEH